MAEGRALRVAVLVGVWIAVMGAASLVPGCYGRNCDVSVEIYGNDPGEGQMIDDVTWQSNPVEGGWLPLPGNRIWVFQVPQLMGKRHRMIMPYVSGSPAPLDAGANYTIGSGNGTVIVPFPDGSFWVQNATCADYFVRVQAEIFPGPEDGGADAGDGSAPEAGIQDAGTD